ncbi:LOW QUALITY PROTEIN: DNA repair protein REV1-like [Daphnia magna]|uniref:LOW QUALITY PROTEIN: DNA repair protein REV1-like n=1 Tax=Daphnia magna TaxID=35525 RepID=UPI001E1BB302|nr:LOW QUALITY PROTEIN: DNA repair protein REV1-like [Daphnia magna]
MAGRGKRKLGDDNGFGDKGGYMAAKISKLENQYLNEKFNEACEEEKLSNIFLNIAIFVNGYTNPTAEELKRIMLAHGGIYHHYYNSRATTHIIASNLCDGKIKKLKGDEKFVKPEWIVDSVKAHSLLDLKPYLLYTGLTLDKGQQKLGIVSMAKKEDVTYCENRNERAMVTDSTEKNSASDIRQSREMKRAGEDDFLSEFYKRSRLHHISTMGALFKRHVTELRGKNNGVFPGMENIENWKKTSGYQGSHKNEDTVFMHIDMDCFFVSVGLRNYPSLVGKPVVVTHEKADSKPLPRREGRNREYEFECYKEHWIKKSKFSESNNADETEAGLTDVFPRLQDLDETCSMSEIASCSYEARAAGIYNGMFMGAALKLCPSLVAIPYDFEGYKEVSTLLYNTVASYTLDLEAVSCDELYADITTVLRQTGLTPSDFATHLKEVIFSKTRCNASVGMGPNMLMARLATKKAKPNGLFYIQKGEMVEFMKSHKIEDLPGVGRSMAHRFHALGVNACLEMQQVTLGKLQQEFGQKQGQTFYYMCRGEDKRSLKTEHIRKSISADINYGMRFANDQEMYKFVQELSSEVSERMEEIHVRGRLLTLKLKIRAKDAPVETAKFMGHGVCDSISRSTTLVTASHETKIIEKEVQILLKQLKVDCCELRGMGIQFSKLVADNVSKGKQPKQNSLLSFVARSKIFPSENLVTTVPPEDIVKTVPSENFITPCIATPNAEEPDNEKVESDGKQGDGKRANDNARFELPSFSQIDPTVLDQLPNDLKADIIQEYQRQGIALSGVNSLTKNYSEPVAGPSKAEAGNGSSLADSQIDPLVFDQLRDDLKNDIIQEYQRKGITLSVAKSSTENFPKPIAGTSKTETALGSSVTKESVNSSGTSLSEKPVSYDGIEEITDIDASYWSALPDDIRVEIERDIQQRKSETTSPMKGWKSIFKPQRSPVKAAGKILNGKTKAETKRKTKFQEIPKAKVQPTIPIRVAVAQEKVVIDAKRLEAPKEELALSGASTLPEIRQLLLEWFSSCDSPESEDCEAVSKFLACLVNNKELHKIEPIILFLRRRSVGQSDSWKRTVDDIINTTQLYVIQYYNAPLKLPSSFL